MNAHTIFAATAALTVAALAGSSYAQTYAGGGGALGDATTDGNFGTVPTVTRFEIFVPDHGTILDFQSASLDVMHTWTGDLHITLTHEQSGTSLMITDRPGVPASTFGNSDDLDGVYSFEDGFPALPETSSGGVIAPGSYGAEGGSFAVFNGLDRFGTWTLAITDNALGDTGVLEGWEITMSGVPAPGALALLGLAGAISPRRRRR